MRSNDSLSVPGELFHCTGDCQMVPLSWHGSWSRMLLRVLAAADATPRGTMASVRYSTTVRSA
eukprot:13504412-Alexandrium_andersonii.AAC.1